MTHLEMLFLAASLLFKRRREIEMGGGAETFFNSVLWVGKEENICSKKKKIFQKIVSSFIKSGD